ncbi:hypothetical protein ABIC80_004826 [Kosakonia sp. 1610]|jgi:hypothetical protein
MRGNSLIHAFRLYMRAGVKRKEFMDGACPKDAREQVMEDLPEPECKNPPKSV